MTCAVLPSSALVGFPSVSGLNKKSKKSGAKSSGGTQLKRAVERRVAAEKASKRAAALNFAAAAMLGVALAVPVISSRSYPLVIAPLPAASGNDDQRIRVGVFDANGQRVIHAQIHGRTQLGPLPAGDYMVEVVSAVGSDLQKIHLGPGKRAIVRYSMEA